MDAEAPVSPAEELSELARSMRAWLEILRGSGAEGVPQATVPWPRPVEGSAPEEMHDLDVESSPPSSEGEPFHALERGSSSLHAGAHLGSFSTGVEHLVAQTPTVAPASPFELTARSAGSKARASTQAGAQRITSLSIPALEVPTTLAERGTELALLNDRVRSCQGCALAKTRTQTVFARGRFDARLCFVGEGPGEQEDLRGEPFVGPAGELLDRMIAAMQLARDEVYICNVVKCRPPNNRTPSDVEIAACSTHLHHQLALANPEVIVALGNTAIHGLLGPVGGITRLRGKWKLYNGKIPVMPTYHPSYLLRMPAAKKEAWDDLKLVMSRLKLPTKS